jgi:hypothetical protein
VALLASSATPTPLYAIYQAQWHFTPITTTVVFGVYAMAVLVALLTLAVFEGQGELFAQPGYRGCAFARASAESYPGDLAEQAAEAYRRWVRALLTELAEQVGVPDPEILARQLHLLYDGSGQSARMDHDPAAAAAARAAAATLLDAALAPGTSAG